MGLMPDFQVAHGGFRNKQELPVELGQIGMQPHRRQQALQSGQLRGVEDRRVDLGINGDGTGPWMACRSAP